jgi:predicted phage baseplate assembly protein
MPLIAPELDTAKFEDILKEARLRIPRYTPEWTDFNESDPGITLLQLFAWLTEMMLYKMNQVPERNYIKFLQLFGLELRAAQPAEAHLTFSPKAGAPVSGPVPAGTRVSAQSQDGKQLIFTTENGLDMVPFPLSDVQVYDGAGFTVATAANEKPGTGFQPLGYEPQIGSALYLGFKPPQPLPPDQHFPLEMHFRVFLPAAAQGGVPQLCDGRNLPPPPPVTLVWEYRHPADLTGWRSLKVFQDGSTAFTREGYVLLEGPEAIAATQEGKVADPRFWIRVRLAAKSYGAGVTPEIDLIRPNTVQALNLVTVRQELVGVSEGLPRQTFTLSHAPVAPGSLTLTVDGVNWTKVDDFLSSSGMETRYVLHASTGQIIFGDGTHGEIPPAGDGIVATEYRYGGGTAGNVEAGQITTIMSPVVGVDKVTNERPAVGGRNEQNVEELKEQAPALLRCGDRAVTADDFSLLATQAGGVAKATALPLAHPDHPGVEVAGAVTVVIVPDSKDQPPQPSSDLIRSVCAYLDGFRLLTTELYVRGPVYKSIRIEATVQANPYAAFDAVSRDVVNNLNNYMSPLADPAATPPVPGWNFGQELYPTNLFSVLLKAPDVVAVENLRVFVDNQPHDDLNQPVQVGPEGLIYGAANHDITVKPAVNL